MLSTNTSIPTPTGTSIPTPTGTSIPTATGRGTGTMSIFQLPNWLYINESIVNITNFASYISEIPNNDKNFNVIQLYDYEDINNYIDNEITIFYNTFSNNQNVTDKYGKSMLQRYLDIISMQSSFSKIMKNTSTYILGTDAYDLYTKNNEMKSLRNKIDININQMNDNNGHQLENKMKLDSTIYSAVLWTILIILLLYYVFVNM
jgi:hypothetical protein